MIAVEPENGKTFSLKEMQKIVDGYIEVVGLRDGRIMVLNEEGKLKGMKLNEGATQMFGFDWVVGPVLVCPSEMME